MSWANKLFDTYENNIKFYNGNECSNNEFTKETEKLTPPYHVYQKAAIEVTLDEHADFQHAVEINKDDLYTLIPATDASSIRSSGIAPHPLCDTLSYIAGDFSEYGGTVRVQKGVSAHDAYMEQLKEWATWTEAHEKVKIIYEYLSKNCLTRDLIACKILETDGNGMLTQKKINTYEPERMLVRFVVLVGDKHRTWEDTTLTKNYIDYVQQNTEYPIKLDMLSGEFAPTKRLHPKGIVPSQFNAKLISSQDMTNFTYIGRFLNSEQAANLGFESSQKIHAALTWLLKNQGVRIGSSERYYVYWSPNPQVNTHLLTRALFAGNVFEQNENFSGTSLNKSEKENLQALLLNIKKEITPRDEMIVMGLEAPSKGNLAIVDYYEFNANDFIDMLLRWNDSCSWYFPRKGGPVVESPSFYRIANAVYGIERNGRLETDDKVFRDAVTRLQKCMLTGQAFPYDMVRTIFNQASNLQKYEKNKQSVLSTACAIVRKYYYDRGKEETDMVLNKTCTDRSYLFGRLLAIYERIEKVATYKPDAKDSHETNALRLQQAFVLNPGKVWKTLDNQITPYLQKLKANQRAYYKNLIAEVVSLFENDDVLLPKSLDEKYLLGYYLQRADFFSKEPADDEESQIEE